MDKVRDCIRALQDKGFIASTPGGHPCHWGDLYLAWEFQEREHKNVLPHLSLLRAPAPLEAFYTDAECNLLLEVQDGETPWNPELPDDIADALQRSCEAQESRASYRTRRMVANRHISDPAVRARIIERDGGQCRNCGSEASVTLDHVVSVYNGGGNEDANLQVLCRSCNSRKGSR